MMFCTTCSRERESADGRCPVDGTDLVRRPTNISGSTTGQLALATDSMDSADELVAGTEVGEYVIEQRIGQGGMGVVYAARHPLIGKRAAIKVLNAKYSADQDSVARFILEAKAVNQIGHANIIDVFSFGTLADGRSYFVMELLRGETLHSRLERAPMLVSEAIPLIVALARALEAAHGAGVIHRDLKPENVFLVSEDDVVRVKLLDFGIAKLSSSTGLIASRTATGITMGTPLFMSPEQARGLEVDARTDLYSLGVLAYQMVCRVTPFESEASAVEVMTAHIAKPPRPPSHRVPDVPPVLETVILELLAKQPSDRPSLQDVRRRLTRLATSPIETGPALAAVPAASPQTPTLPLVSTRHSATSTTSAGAQNDESIAEFDQPRRGSIKWIVLGALVAIGFAAFLITRKKASPPPELQQESSRTPTRIVTPPPPATPPIPATSEVREPALVEPPVPDPAQTGTLELDVSPVTATITIDERAVVLVRGKARIELAPGRHEIASTAPGYWPFKRQIEVAESRAVLSTIRLRPRATNRPAGATGSAAPSGPTDTDAVVNPFAKGSKQP